nr:beta-3-deoxy-D-manno-oct-2-ulosonic acid transferase [Ramlibacter cellulosilyticus]
MFTPGPLAALGFSLRKRPLLRQFTGRDDIRFLASAARLPQEGTLLAWGSTVLADVPAGLRIVRVEDGFLRSVGLGADLTRPSSWVFDDTGIYYDATRPSALESLLQRGERSPAERARARALREAVVAAGLTKYNLPERRWHRPRGDRRVVLACGQVESDASLRLGGTTVRSNLALVKAVRRACPDAWLVYKPHPDVVAGLRARGENEAQVARHCDEVVSEASVPALVEEVDEVHVMTSLLGFEALLRGKPVVCHGSPFYAGWGLAREVQQHPRRAGPLSLDSLVHAALVEYPVYWSREAGRRCSPEEAVQELLALRARRPAVAAWRRVLRPLLARA